MITKWLTRGLPMAALLCALVLPAHASFPEFEDVQSRVGDPSPSQTESRVNDYINQDEQVNILPTDGLIKVLRTDQKALVNDYVVAVFPINHAVRREMRNVMRQVTKLEGGRAEVFQDKKGTGQQYILVTAPKFMIPYLRDAVAALDVPWLREYDDGASDFYVQMRHRRAADVDVVASQYAGGEGFSEIDTTNNALRRFDENYRNREYAKAVKMVDIPCNQVELTVKVYEVAASNDLKLGLDYINWSNGPGRNLFTFAEAGYSAEQRARGLTSVFDPFLDARARVFSDVERGKELVLDTDAIESFRAVNYLLPSSYVDFLQAKGEAQVVHTQKLLLCTAESGTISSDLQVLAFVNNLNEIDQVSPGQSQPFIVRDNDNQFFTEGGSGSSGQQQFVPDNGFGGEAPLGSAPSFVRLQDSNRRLRYENAGSVGISMEVTPYVGLESMELEIELDIGELNGLTPSGTPIINTRTVDTTVRLLDGQPYVIAGIKRKKTIETTAKAPWLGSIPLLGYIFGGEQDIQRQNDVVITITPRFHLASQVSIATPPRIDTMQLIVDDGNLQGAPSMSFGFDQYLLGG